MDEKRCLYISLLTDQAKQVAKARFALLLAMMALSLLITFKTNDNYWFYAMGLLSQIGLWVTNAQLTFLLDGLINKIDHAADALHVKLFETNISNYTKKDLSFYLFKDFTSLLYQSFIGLGCLKIFYQILIDYFI
jgi:hypothetical protein